MSDRIDESTVPAQDFANFSRTSASRAPLYAALADGIAGDPELSRLLLLAPPTQRLPVLLFASVHVLLLEAPTEPLARWYPNITTNPLSPSDPALLSAFKHFVAERADALRVLLSTRTTQTNEVGRCSLLLPAFGLLADEVGSLGHLDVGASGGLNLLLDRFQYRYLGQSDTVTTVGDDSPVVLECAVSGQCPLPTSIPAITAQLGIDRSPIDVTDVDQARWLEACVWPDQADRFHRLVAAIDLARTASPELLTGDAVTSLAAGVERVGASAHPVVTNSWVLNYLTSAERMAYLAELERIGSERDISWVYAEAPAQIPELPTGPDPKDPHLTVLSMARWRNGERTIEHLATCHPHGFWLRWR